MRYQRGRILSSVATVALWLAGCKTSERESPGILDAGSKRSDAVAVRQEAGASTEPASVFDVFERVFADTAAPPARGDIYSLYYLSGPGGSRPVMVQCRVGPDGSEVRVNEATGTAGQPETWGRGRDSWRKLAAHDAAEVHRLAQVFADQIRNGTYAENQSGFMDGAMVATEVSVEGRTVRVVRSDPNDGTLLSPFEKELFTLAANVFDGGIPGVRMRLPRSDR
jgi:hypothetical protein